MSWLKWLLAGVLILNILPSSTASAATNPLYVSLGRAQISPNGDGDRDNATVTVTTTVDAYRLALRLLDSRSVGLGEFAQVSPALKGTRRFTFDGSYVNGSGTRTLAPEGQYYIQGALIDQTGKAIATVRRQVFINNTLKNVAITATPLAYNGYNSIFSPNGDGRKDGVVASFSLTRAATVYMHVLSKNVEIERVTGTYSQAGTGSITWSGKYTYNGQRVWAPQGNYTILIEAVPSDQSLAATIRSAYSSRSMTADTQGPWIWESASTSEFAPSEGETLKISYTSDQPGYKLFTVLNANSQVVYAESWSSTGTSGTWTWNGRKDGKALPPGNYRVNLYIQDRAGNAAQQYPKYVNVQLVVPPNSGQSSKIPWSGWWWPMLNTYSHLLYSRPGPMTKYDAYVKSIGGNPGAYTYEYNNHRTTDPANDWWGHCQAWAAAAIMEPQPRGITKNGIAFSQDDAEGLYSETWTYHTGEWWGTRYDGGGKDTEAYKDVYPADFDRVVRYWIGIQHTALMMDFTTGAPVWNYPVYGFKRTSTRSGDLEYVTMTLTRAAPYYGYSGTAPLYRTFYYTLKTGTNGWWSNPSGSSVDTHPDYIVRVTGRSEFYGNPYVDPSVLNQLFR